MRIGQIDKQMKWSGQTRQTFLIAETLRQRGNEVFVVCQPGSAIGKRAAEVGIQVIHLSMRGWRIFPSAMRLIWRLWRRRCDILHAHGGRDHVLAMLAGVPAPGAKVIRTKNNLTTVRNPIFCRWFTRKLIAVSEAARKVLLKAGVEPGQIRKIHNGIDTDEFKPAPPDAALLAQFGIQPGDFVIGAVARMGSKSKGIPVLLRAAVKVLAKAPQVRFLLVGRSNPSIAEHAQSLGLGARVIFTGFRSDMPKVFSVMSLCVQPSVNEALGCSILEAMAMGKPVVATRTGGIPEVVIEGETGLLCAPQDADDLARVLLELVNQPATLAEMGRRARERALKTFDLTRMVDALEQTHRDVAKGRA